MVFSLFNSKYAIKELIIKDKTHSVCHLVYYKTEKESISIQWYDVSSLKHEIKIRGQLHDMNFEKSTK